MLNMEPKRKKRVKMARPHGAGRPPPTPLAEQAHQLLWQKDCTARE